jgi:hypothetical protein
MRKFASVKIVSAVLGLAACAGIAASFAVAHEGHEMACDATGMNAMMADLQAMPDGAAKSEATKEMQMAHEMMGKQDMKGCSEHMDKAMKAMEK